MITFILCLALLIGGYFLYGKITERIFGIDPERETPAFAKQDGIDYLPMKPWRIFMIQFLNIAGVGPIFGAIMGAKFGVSSFLWIVFGSIFAGGVHDYMSGMMSMRMGGASLPEIHGKYLGNTVKQAMRVLTLVLLVLVGVVFLVAPSGLLAHMTDTNMLLWIGIILLYYFVATMFPIDKIIGNIYPLFAFCLLFMEFGNLTNLLIHHPALPEVWEGAGNLHPQAATNPIFPMMFISIACGAISGFHATQSPMMARCIPNERQGRPIFFGAMLAEGVIALVWAAAASYFYFDTPGGKEVFETGTNPSIVVNSIAREWFGPLGAILVVMGVIVAPISTGDTAFRSARLIVADSLNIDQKPILKRVMIALPLFALSGLLLWYNLSDKNGFEKIWRYFGWSNQTLSVFTLWAITVYLVQKKKWYIVTLIPALFMTMVCSTFVFYQKDAFLGLNETLSYSLGGLVTLSCLVWFIIWKQKAAAKPLPQEDFTS